jgi:predicted transport protein
MKGGFAESPLRLNAGLGALVSWNEDAIKHRAEALAEQSVQVWSAPSLDPAVLAPYRPNVKPSVHGIDDHPHLAVGAMRPVFEAFRKEILALDPCVTEEFLKYYVAYKAETNFVDVIPQAKRLVLSLSISPSEIDDPRGISRDVSGLGHWGNGDVELSLSSVDDLPYVVGVVRQSLERQLGVAADV